MGVAKSEETVIKYINRRIIVFRGAKKCTTQTAGFQKEELLFIKKERKQEITAMNASARVKNDNIK